MASARSPNSPVGINNDIQISHRTLNQASPTILSNVVTTTTTNSKSNNNNNNHHHDPQHQHQPQSYETLGSPSVTSYNSEEISETISSLDEESINDLSQKFSQLQRKIDVLTETQVAQDERYRRSKQENDLLLNRLHNLEDQLRDMELNSELRAKEDDKRFKGAMSKFTKVQHECEQHLQTIFQLQQEVFKMHNDLLKYESVIKSLRSDKEQLESELLDKNNELTSQDEEIHRLKSMVKELQDEENKNSRIISILNEELEDNQSNQSQRQHQPLDTSRSTKSSEDEFFGNSSRLALKDIDGLEIAYEKLGDECKQLRAENEELQAQLLSAQLEQGRCLVQDSMRSYSLADEMGDIDEIKKALKQEQDDNSRIRKYMDEILTKIVESNPDLLDKTSFKGKKQNGTIV